MRRSNWALIATIMVDERLCGEGDMVWKQAVSMTAGALVLAGCLHAGGPSGYLAPITESAVVGTWQDKQTGQVLRFDADGSFTATDLPYQMLANHPSGLPQGFDPDKDKLQAVGEWLLGPLGQPEGTPRYRVLLLPDTVAGQRSQASFELVAERESETAPFVLSIYIGDPDLDNRIVYERCTAPCAPPAD
jgi:hypothetical protein